MKNYFYFILFFLLLTSSKLSFGQNIVAVPSSDSLIKEKIYSQEEITILITDSGLGGVSICAGIEKALAQLRAFKNVNLIFFNALQASGITYNSLSSMEKKAEVFDKMLQIMESSYSPDFILIACNTLSVVYPYTNFATSSSTPVLGIVEFGIEMVQNEYKKKPNTNIILLGTETTISSNSHKNLLIENGLSEVNIFSQSCPSLETEIQHSPKSELVSGMIDLYVDEVLSEIKQEKEGIIAALCCSHYGYSSDLFENSFKNLAKGEITIINPNEGMINSIINEKYKNRINSSKINVNIVSLVVIPDTDIKSISDLIKSEAPITSQALINYQYKPDLMEILKK